MSDTQGPNSARLTEALVDSSILIQPTQQQQKIIEEFLLEDVETFSSNALHKQTQEEEEDKENIILEGTESQVSNKQNITKDTIDLNQNINSNAPIQQAASEIPIQRFIVDVKYQASLGNLLPWAYAIENKMMRIDDYDSNENSLLHKAAWYQQLDLVVACIDRFGIDVNLAEKNGSQTVLMIACLLGNLKMVKYLIDKGAKVNAKDNNGFSPIMNAVLNRHKFIVIYLLAHNADFKVLDSDGCNIAHRAAFNNDLPILQILYSVDKSLFEVVDRLKLAPVGRAITNESHQAFAYLQRVRPILIPDKNFNILQNKYMAKLIQAEHEKQNARFFSFAGLLRIYNKFPQAFCLLIYAVVLIFMSRIIRSQAEKVKDISKFYENLILTSQITTMILFASVFSFLFISQCPSKQLLPRKPFLQLQNLNTLQQIDYLNINTLFKRKSSNLTLPHSDFNLFDYIFSLIKTEKFNNLFSINPLSFCFACLDLKREREHHCDEFSSCIQGFSHFSKFFKKLIVDQVNRSYYQAIIGLQLLTVLIFFIANLLFCNSRYEFEGRWILTFYEIPFIYYQNEEYLYLFAYLFSCVNAYIAFIYFFIEMICIMLRVTQYELFNPQLCQEFYPTSNLVELTKTSQLSGANTEQYFHFYSNPYSRCLPIGPSVQETH